MAPNLDARKKRATIVVAIVVPILFAGIAVPTLISKASDPIVGVDDVDHGPSAALEQVAGVRAVDEPSNAESTGAVAAAAAAETAAEAPLTDDVPRLSPSVDGDLHIELALSAATQHTDSPVRAIVSLRNLTLEDFHVPDRGEPQPTLTIVVLDTDGNEVRRVVESSDDPLPRNMRLLQSGDSLELEVSIVAEDEAGLAPGSYRAYAEFTSDPGWTLIGIRCYQQGPVPPRSEWMTFDVTD